MTRLVPDMRSLLITTALSLMVPFLASPPPRGEGMGAGGRARITAGVTS
jgi:hypothetical protein